MIGPTDGKVFHRTATEAVLENLTSSLLDSAVAVCTPEHDRFAGVQPVTRAALRSPRPVNSAIPTVMNSLFDP